MIPYSNFMTLYDAGAPVKIIAGGGVQGCIIVAREGIKSAADLKGKSVTFTAEPQPKPNANGHRTAYVEGPGGVRIELVEHMACLWK